MQLSVHWYKFGLKNEQCTYPSNMPCTEQLSISLLGGMPQQIRVHCIHNKYTSSKALDKKSTVLTVDQTKQCDATFLGNLFYIGDNAMAVCQKEQLLLIKNWCNFRR